MKILIKKKRTEKSAAFTALPMLIIVRNNTGEPGGFVAYYLGKMTILGKTLFFTLYSPIIVTRICQKQCTNLELILSFFLLLGYKTKYSFRLN